MCQRESHLHIQRRSRGGFTWLLLLSLMAGAGCRPQLDEWRYETDFPVDVGFGWTSWRSYHEFGALALEQGLQGGQHITASLRLYDHRLKQGVYTCYVSLIDLEQNSVEAEEDAAPCEVGTAADLSLSPPEDLDASLLIAPSLLVQVPADVEGKTLELRVQVQSADGDVGRAWVQAPVVNVTENPPNDEDLST